MEPLAIDTDQPAPMPEIDPWQYTDDIPEEPVRRYPKRDRKPRNAAFHYTNRVAKPTKPKRSKIDADQSKKMERWFSSYKWSDCKLAAKYDKEHNFYPKPGPSMINYYEDEEIPGYYRPVTKPAKPKTCNTRANRSPALSTRARKQRKLDTQPESENSDWENDVHVQSFYEQSCLNGDAGTPNGYSSPVSTDFNPDVSLSTPAMNKMLNTLLSSDLMENHENMCKIQLVANGPSHKDVDPIAQKVHPVPFYSDPNDVSSKKEVGHNVLQLKGNGLNDCERFESDLGIDSMQDWLRRCAAQPTQYDKDSNEINDSKTVQSKLANASTMNITPGSQAPSCHDMEQWITVRTRQAKKANLPRMYSPESTNHVKATAAVCPANVNTKDQADVLATILANKEITFSRCTSNGKKQVMSPNDNLIIDICDEDDVVVLDAPPSQHNSQMKSVRARK